MFWEGNEEEGVGRGKLEAEANGVEEQDGARIRWGMAFQGSSCVIRKASMIQCHTIP